MEGPEGTKCVKGASSDRIMGCILAVMVVENRGGAVSPLGSSIPKVTPARREEAGAMGGINDVGEVVVKDECLETLLITPGRVCQPWSKKQLRTRE